MRTCLAAPALTVIAVVCASAADRDVQATNLTQCAERAYQNGDFERARQLFASATTHLPGYIPAELGLARVDFVESYRKRALERVDRLTAAHPDDPALVALRDQLTEEAHGYDNVSSAYRPYRIPLKMDQRTAVPEGVFLIASINGSKPLRLLLDTGASHVLLSPRAAAGVPVPLTKSGSISTYDKALRSARIGVGEVRIGELELNQVLVFSADVEFDNGIDGLIGTRLFREFLVNIDVRGKQLRLDPFPEALPQWINWDRDETWKQRGFQPLYQLGHYLLLKAENGSAKGTFLFDTGANFNALAGDRFPLQSWSKRNGVRLDGVLGFPTILHSKLTLNYRDGFYKLAD